MVARSATGDRRRARRSTASSSCHQQRSARQRPSALPPPTVRPPAPVRSTGDPDDDSSGVSPEPRFSGIRPGASSATARANADRVPINRTEPPPDARRSVPANAPATPFGSRARYDTPRRDHARPAAAAAQPRAVVPGRTHRTGAAQPVTLCRANSRSESLACPAEVRSMRGQSSGSACRDNGAQARALHVRHRSLPARRSPRRRDCSIGARTAPTPPKPIACAGTGSIAAIRTTPPGSPASGSRAKARRSSATIRRCRSASRSRDSRSRARGAPTRWSRPSAIARDSAKRWCARGIATAARCSRSARRPKSRELLDRLHWPRVAHRAVPGEAADAARRAAAAPADAGQPADLRA